MSRITVMDLWLDQKKLDAVKHVLEEQGSSAEKRMEEMFEDLYREIVPLPIREQIEREIQKESEQAAAEAAGRTKVTAYRVTENGRQSCIRTDIGSDILMTALRLERYLSAPAAGGFEDLLSGQAPISDEEYDRLAVLRLEKNETVTGVFDLDFDRAEFSSVDPEEGWRTFPMSSVCSAMLRTNQKQGLSHEQSREVLMKNLEGWAIPSPGHLSMDALAFEGQINVLAGRLVFQIDPEAWFDSLDPVFGTNTCTAENNDFLTVRACYDTEKGEVCSALEVTLNQDEGWIRKPDYILNSVERECLRKKMDEYCQQQVGVGLAEYGAGIQRSQAAAMPSGPVSDFDLISFYAEMGIAAMAERYMELQRREHPKVESIRILKVEPGTAPEAVTMPNTLDTFQAAVGGDIELLGLDANAALVCNELGKLIGLPANRMVGGDTIAGTFLIVGMDDGDFCSLSDEDAAYYAEQFAQPMPSYSAPDEPAQWEFHVL